MPLPVEDGSKKIRLGATNLLPDQKAIVDGEDGFLQFLGWIHRTWKSREAKLKRVGNNEEWKNRNANGTE